MSLWDEEHSAAVQIDNIDLPGVFEIDVDYKIIGSRDRSPSGSLISNTTTIKKVVEISCRPKAKESFQSIIDHLIAENFGAVNILLDEYMPEEGDPVEDDFIVGVASELTTSRILDLQGQYDFPIEITLVFEEV